MQLRRVVFAQIIWVPVVYLLGLAVVFLAVFALGWEVWARVVSTNEQWPDGRTRAVRASAEALLPAYPGALFQTVTVTRGVDTPYSECVVYQTQDQTSQVASYYRTLFEAQGWSVYALFSRPGLYTTDQSVTESRGSDGTTFRVAPSPNGRASVRFPPDPPGPGERYPFRVCSKSFEAALAAAKGR